MATSNGPWRCWRATSPEVATTRAWHKPSRKHCTTSWGPTVPFAIWEFLICGISGKLARRGGLWLSASSSRRRRGVDLGCRPGGCLRRLQICRLARRYGPPPGWPTADRCSCGDVRWRRCRAGRCLGAAPSRVVRRPARGDSPCLGSTMTDPEQQQQQQQQKQQRALTLCWMDRLRFEKTA